MRDTELEIRVASLDDAGSLAILAARTFRDTYPPLDECGDLEEYISLNFAPARIAADIRDPASSIFLAFIGGEPVGYAALRTGPAPEYVHAASPMELVRLYVLQGTIGTGCGSALMQACLEEQKRLGCDAIWLGVWDQNLRACSFYEKWGFSRAGTCPFVLGEMQFEDIVMVRQS
jgi:GNAT superfamily N-acetyltransferase